MTKLKYSFLVIFLSSTTFQDCVRHVFDSLQSTYRLGKGSPKLRVEPVIKSHTELIQ